MKKDINIAQFMRMSLERDYWDIWEGIEIMSKECEVKVMTSEEFKEQMLEISKHRDREDRHRYADNLMCEVLRQFGYGDGVDIFEDMGKWYS